MREYHRPIMLREVLDGLAIRSGGVYFDGTVGGGGHSYGILSSDPTVKLIGTDRDGEAVAEATERLRGFGERVRIVHTNFKNYAQALGEERLDGFLLDLGVSSHQIDDAARGFSYRQAEAPLDMRMDRRGTLTAADVVNGYPEDKLRRILREYGEEPFAAAIARNIVRARQNGTIRTCGELREIAEASMPPKFRSPACARQTFQAIRIEVNGELDGLGECIAGLIRRLKKGGRACVLTFHSLEDRIVKQVFRTFAEDCVCPPNFPVCVCGKRKEIRPIGRKPITADEEEIKQNSRAKSAKLRIAEKIIE